MNNNQTVNVAPSELKLKVCISITSVLGFQSAKLLWEPKVFGIFKRI